LTIIRIQKEYDIKPLELSQRALREVMDLFFRGGGSISGDWTFLDWQYNQNPAGKAIGFNAYHRGKLVAHYAVIPVKVTLFGSETLGVLSINTRTDSEHQGQGLFTQLAHLTYERAKQSGHEFVVGVANQNSVYGFTKKLGFQHVGLLETRMVAKLPSSLTEILDYEPVWDQASVVWRLGNPQQHYQFKRLGDKAFIFGRSSRFRTLMGEIDAVKVPRDLIELTPSANPFKLWIGISSNTVWTHSLSIKIPQGLKKVPLNLIFRDLVGNRTINSNAVKFWAMDFDAY
jgi:GNAT superfamily N-acetyltransferase